ncbi:5352_t:CDS:1, partial [Acaulospora morrowiae]
IRSLRYLEELLKEMTVAANTIGNSELEKKFDSAAKVLRR